MVSAIGHPEYYRGDNPICSPNQVPDVDWHVVEKEGLFDDLIEQHSGLLLLISKNELIRNVQLFTATKPEIQWEPWTK